MGETLYHDYRNVCLKSIEVPFLEKTENFEWIDPRSFQVTQTKQLFKKLKNYSEGDSPADPIDTVNHTNSSSKTQKLYQYSLYPGLVVKLKLKLANKEVIYLPVTVYYQYGPYIFTSNLIKQRKLFFKDKPEIFESEHQQEIDISSITRICKLNLNKFNSFPPNFQSKFNKLLRAVNGRIWYHPSESKVSTPKYHGKNVVLNKNEKADQDGIFCADFFIETPDEVRKDEYRLRDLIHFNISDLLLKKSNDEFENLLKRYEIGSFKPDLNS